MVCRVTCIVATIDCHRVAARFASSALFESQLTQAGLQLKSTDVPAEPLIPLEWYADTNGPLNEVCTD